MLERALFAAGLATALSVPLWSAQKSAGAALELRTVQGTVLRVKNVQAGYSSPIVVYLYDDRTQSVRTCFADTAGRYRFSGLNPFDDYQVYAQRAGATSRMYLISSEDARRDFVLNLRVPQRK
jgi:hypothetical protein